MAREEYDVMAVRQKGRIEITATGYRVIQRSDTRSGTRRPGVSTTAGEGSLHHLAPLGSLVTRDLERNQMKGLSGHRRLQPKLGTMRVSWDAQLRAKPVSCSGLLDRPPPHRRP